MGMLFSLVLRLSVQQLNPEILVCKMAALMINVAAEKNAKTDRMELLSLSMLIKAMYILYFLSLNKSVRERRGRGIMVCCGTTFVMLNPIPNLPVLIGHHKHPFTKQRIVSLLRIGGGGGQSSTGCSQMADTG